MMPAEIDLPETVETVPGERESSPPPVRGGERYQLLERLDEGAMGVVWIAEDTALHRQVAIKLLHDQFLGAERQEQLAREARAMARLSHPNVVAVHDVGEREGRTFIAMELVEGKTLSRWLEEPRSWQEVLEVFRGVAAGLAAAHAAGVVHRDIKPSNILIGDDGRARIADFGVAHAGRRTGESGEAVTTTSTRGLIGSPAYMPPERLNRDPAGTRGDQFGFCATFHEALHGERPFRAETVDGLVAAIERGVPPPLRAVPRWLHAVLARGLAADPAARFASMASLLEALRGPPPRSRAGLVALGVALGAAVAVAVALAVSGPAERPGPALTLAPDAATSAEEPPVVSTADRVTERPSAIPDAAVPEAIAEVKPDGGVRRTVERRTPKASLDGLSNEELKARFYEMRNAMIAAASAGDFAKASRIAEELTPVAYRYRAGPAGEYEKMAIIHACRAGNGRRARTLFKKMPGKHPPVLRSQKLTAVEICRRHGVELEDLLED